MPTIKKVNKSLEPFNVELVKGKGYFYFVSDIYSFHDSSVMVNNINQLSLYEWVKEALERINNWRTINHK